MEATLIGPSGQPGVAVNDSGASIYRRVFPDVVAQLSACTTGTMGAMEMNLGSWMAGFTRTYTTRADGGAYGDVLPFYPSGGWPVQHFSGMRISDEFRVNVGLYNGLDYPVTHRLIVYNADGEEVQRREVVLAPRQSWQQGFMAVIGDLAPGLYGLTVLPLDQPSQPGRSWAYVAIVDNTTGDPTNLW